MPRPPTSGLRAYDEDLLKIIKTRFPDGIQGADKTTCFIIYSEVKHTINLSDVEKYDTPALESYSTNKECLNNKIYIWIKNSLQKGGRFKVNRKDNLQTKNKGKCLSAVY